MKRFTKILSLLLLTFVSVRVSAQDIHFSQYFNNPLSYNPANTGNFSGDWRIAGNYRDQWRALSVPYTTYSVSFDRQFYYKSRHFSAGMYVLSDQSGNVALKSNQIFVSGAYHAVYNDHYIDFGIQAGYVMKRIDMGNLSFPDQWDQSSGYFNPSLQTEAAIDKDHLGYADVNAGIIWHKRIRIFEPEVGFALSHINMPRETFFNDKNSLPMRKTLHASLHTNLLENLYLKPGILINRMTGANDFIVGTDIGYGVASNRFSVNQIHAGVYWRNGLIDVSDAMMFVVGAQVRNYAFSVSYDFNVSPLNQFTNHRGAFEVSFIYKSISTIIKTFTVPCERF